MLLAAEGTKLEVTLYVKKGGKGGKWDIFLDVVKEIDGGSGKMYLQFAPCFSDLLCTAPQVILSCLRSVDKDTLWEPQHLILVNGGSTFEAGAQPRDSSLSPILHCLPPLSPLLWPAHAIVIHCLSEYKSLFIVLPAFAPAFLQTSSTLQTELSFKGRNQII